MSGIVGSKLNIRGSGLVGSLGTDGQHLLSSGAGKTNTFETSAAGGHTKIVTATLGSAATEWNIDDVFTSDYKFYVVYIYNLTHATTTEQSWMRLRTGGASGSTQSGSNYGWMYRYDVKDSSSNINGVDGGWGATYFAFSKPRDLSNDTDKPTSGFLQFYHPFESDKRTQILTDCVVNEADSTAVGRIKAATRYEAEESHTGFSFHAESGGNVNTGTAIVFGVAE